MKDLSISMLKHNPLSDEPLEVNEYTFFKYYLELLQVKADKFLSDAEIDVLAYVLAGDPSKSYFKRPVSKELEEFLGLTSNHLHQIKDKLYKKNVIQKTEIRGDYVLYKRLAQFQKQMKDAIAENKSIEFKFKFKVE